MPSSTSSSETQNVTSKYDRALPVKSLGAAALVALLVMVALMGTWEYYWRANDAIPSYRNSKSLWAIERRRINQGEGDKTVIVGSSRIFFDIQLDVWEQETGGRPIQLALEGTTPIPIMENLAADPDFTGTLIVGVAPGLFFSGFQFRANAANHHDRESPTQWIGQQASMWAEPYLAFYHFDYSLFTVLKRQDMPVREGVEVRPDVRRLATYSEDRGARMFTKVETNEDYALEAKRIWAHGFVPIEERDEEWLVGGLENRNAQIDRAVAAVATLNERGIEVIFVRNPAEGHYAISEPMYNPRAETWDVLIEKTGALGLHFEDHEAMQGYWLPEWSHMSGSEADRYTAALVKLIARERGIRNRAAGE